MYDKRAPAGTENEEGVNNQTIMAMHGPGAAAGLKTFFEKVRTAVRRQHREGCVGGGHIV